MSGEWTGRDDHPVCAVELDDALGDRLADKASSIGEAS
jgi:hypothetical protein